MSSESRTSESRTSESRTSESRSSESRTSESRTSECHATVSSPSPALPARLSCQVLTKLSLSRASALPQLRRRNTPRRASTRPAAVRRACAGPRLCPRGPPACPPGCATRTPEPTREASPEALCPLRRHRPGLAPPARPGLCPRLRCWANHTMAAPGLACARAWARLHAAGLGPSMVV